MRGDFFVRTWGEDVICNANGGPIDLGWATTHSLLSSLYTTTYTYIHILVHIYVYARCSGSTRMKNSDGLDVDVQNDGKSTKIHTISFLPQCFSISLPCEHKQSRGLNASALSIVNTSHSNTYNYPLYISIHICIYLIF